MTLNWFNPIALARANSVTGRVRWLAVVANVIVPGGISMVTLSIAVLVGMPVIGLIIQSLPETAAKVVIKEWGLMGVIFVVLILALAYFVNRVQQLTNELLKVIKTNTEALTRTSDVIAACELHQAASEQHRGKRPQKYGD